MLRKPPEPHKARWGHFPQLEKYFGALEPSADPMDGWPGTGTDGERAHEQEKYLHQLLSAFLQVDCLNQPAPHPADMKSIHHDLETLGRMCDHFAGIHESTGRQLRTMRREVLEKIEQWLSHAK